ncbi:MAG: hypothetical protein ABS75_32340 [Pelagibacterium sp. SCN 63-23]|nr:MAG: hypothetical protein ABS75_32340 [Pelagibacterium sp. SCN 63-23]
MNDHKSAELTEIERRYAHRAEQRKGSLYDPLLPVNIAFRQERERVVMAMLLRFLAGRSLQSLRILEIGCGNGRNLIDFINWGARPENCVGNELLTERVAAARANLLPATTILQGDASALDLPDGSFDIMLQSTVFSSILDEGLRHAVAANMWRMLAPNGGIFWYDFTVDNPRNPDVTGISQAQIKALFPNSRYTAKKVTLAPPLARRAARLSPGLYPILNTLPFLRTHVVALLRKQP